MAIRAPDGAKNTCTRIHFGSDISSPCNPARALRALVLLLADSALTVGWGKTFWRVGPFFFYKNDRNSETKNRKIDPKVENEPSLQGLQTGP